MSIEVIPVTIANGQSLSDAVDLGNKTLVGIQMPAAWTAAELEFQASYDGSTFGALYVAGQPIRFGTDATRFLAVTNVSHFYGVRWLKVRSGENASPINQGAERIIQLLVRSPTCSVSVSC